MLKRLIKDKVATGLRRQAAVVLIGPRQVGKTTLAVPLLRIKAASTSI
jgi:predicted AAA+ superfamily ATPase